MNNTSYNVGVKIDGSAAGLVKASKEAVAETKALGTSLGKEYTKVGKTREATATKAEKHVRREFTQTQAQTKMLGGSMQREFGKMAQAREALGVRSEKRVQQEIARTEAAYNRLARSGNLSFNEQRRAAQAMRNEVTKLNNEMGKLTTRQKAVATWKVAAGAGAAAGITAALVTPTVRKTMAYDLRLAHLANTAYNDRDGAGRVVGRAELDAMVSDAVRYGGGTRDSGVDTAEALFGSGVFKDKDVKAILREAMLGATANNADPAAFAQMAISASQTMGIASDRMGQLFGMGTFAGQSGGFEIKDMAKWLPQQMAAAKAVGMYGERGFAKLAAVNQASVITAGTKDEAGNNVVNLLAKLGSTDTHKNFQAQGINLPKQLAEGRVKGLDALDVVGNLLKTQLEKDKNYQQVQKQLAQAKNDQERSKVLGAVGDIAQGTLIGKVFADRQALMALYAYMNSRERVNSITEGALRNPDAAQKNMAVIRDTASFKADQAINARDMAFQSTMNKMMPAIGGMADGLNNLMTKYPGYTTAVAAAAAAVTGLAGAAGFAALALRSGVPGLPAGLGRSAGRVGAPLGSALTAAGAGSVVGGLFAAGGLLSLGSANMLSNSQAMRDAMSFDLGGDSAFAAAILNASMNKPGIVGGGSGVRGQGFNDPRIIGSAGSAAALQEALRATEVKGEIMVRVTAAPGLNVETTMNSNSPRIPMKAAVGQTNLGAGN